MCGGDEKRKPRRLGAAGGAGRGLQHEAVISPGDSDWGREGAGTGEGTGEGSGTGPGTGDVEGTRLAGVDVGAVLEQRQRHVGALRVVQRRFALGHGG